MAQPSYYIQELLRQANAADARAYLGISGGGAVKFSAGTVSSNRSDITFSNANGVSFGLDNAGLLTASVAPGATASNKFSAGTLSALRTDLTFNNANGVTFGLDAAGVITGSVQTNYQSPGAYLTTAQPPGAYLTTAMQSQDSSKFAGTGFTTATTAGTNIVGTLSNNGLSLGVPAYLTAATGGGITAIKVSAGTLSSNRSDLTFADSNGVSFGLDTNGVVTATVATNYQSPGAYLTTAQPVGTYAGVGFTSASTAGTAVVATLSTNGLSMGIPPFLTTAASAFTPRLDQILDPTTDKNFAMVNHGLQFRWVNGVSTNATRDGAFEIDMAGAFDGDLLHIHQHQGNQTNADLVHLECEDTNVTALRIQGIASVGMEINMPIKFDTQETSWSVGSVPMILGTTMSNRVANLNADMVDNRHGTDLAGTGTSATNVSVTLDSNGIALSVDAGTATPTLQTWHNLSWYSNFAFDPNVSNTSGLCPIELQARMTGLIFRMLGNWSMTSTQVQSTGVNNVTGTTTSFNLTHQYNFGLYSMVPGNGQSVLGLMTSTSMGATWLVSISFASTTNAVNNTVSQTLNFPGRYGSILTSTTNYASTTQSALVVTSVWTDFTAFKYLDFSMSANLTPGNYWVLYNNVSGTSGGRNFGWAMTTVNQNQAGNSVADMGNAAALSLGGWMSAMGKYTSAATANFSTLTLDNHFQKGNVMPYLAILNPV